MNLKQQQLKTKPIFPLLISMAIPMMFSMLIQSLYNIIDSIFVAKLGNDAFTAVSLIYPLQNLVLSVAVGFGVGVSTCISIAMGSNNYKRAENAATIGVILSFIHSILFVFLGLFATRPFLRLFTDSTTVLDMGTQYGHIVLCFSFGVLIQVCYEKIFQALGNMIVTMYILSIGAIINIILDPILIFGYFGFPKMGISGAAIATVFSQICGFVLYVIYYRRKKDTLPIKISFQSISIKKDIILQLYSVGIPSSIMIAVPSILVSILNGLLVTYSQAHVAILGIYYKLQSFIYLPAGGIVQGMRPIIGFNYGAKDKQRVKKTLEVSLIFTAIIMIIGTVLSLFIPENILTLFDADETMLQIGVPALRIISCGFLISSFGVIYSGAFEALGLGLHSLIISLLRQLIIIIPLSIILSNMMGATGIWIAFPVSEAIAAIVAIILMRKTMKSI